MDRKIFFFDLSGSSVTESLMKSLVVIISFDIFKNRKPNLLKIFGLSVLGETLLFQFSQETFAGSV